MDEESRWNEKYKKGRHRREDPSRFLISWIEKIPKGKALDIGCGAGRNSIYLAENGFDVTGIDISSEALKIARERAEKKQVEVDWVHGDYRNYRTDPETYNLINISYLYIDDLNEIKDLVKSLKTDGYLMWEHHIKTDVDIDIGPDEEFRYERGELLKLLENLLVIEYNEVIEETIQGKRAIVKTIAKKNKR
ncbi:bifunctional 2-polyprenyl-6-hydroxyphenol methylase/3-demethylubiquinol 3-O-methyltransferase UbiG [Methanonatronarchaeum sp. AMET6-2]|uniref:class I SAM-dependent methyltransferase n=1 Tax=Methanonatronarchaeum sp. AMET6-2 TaxID=2933293 RepID=UPI0011F66149|nr:class I SAM-dependent methyltransferase [Methanonatronarchaeum sp. AMET6-2]RZN63358.1 MAG: class I SAM-dependent methyltransferase [Methanonatronarchaeia archaeon]UOY10581.1 class I SAM-dependent methyltransferase [Methanonatronarchaeum sp. AMET6-2]